MSDLVLQIDPAQIPLDTTSVVRLYVSHTGTRALENVRGQLRSPASIRLPGLNRINIPRIDVGEVVCIELPMAGSLPGAALIKFTGLNARTDAGSALDFDDRDLEMNVVDHGHPADVALILESAGNIFQNRIGQLRCKIHNNGSLPIHSPQLTIAAQNCNLYRSTDRSIAEILLPGLSAQIESQILPRVAGALNLSLHLKYSIHGQEFMQTESRVLTVLPSSQIVSAGETLPPTRREERQRILLVTASLSETEPLRVDEEFSTILFEMKHAALQRELFQVDLVLAATLEHLSREISYQFPYLIHFAGHGSEHGIILKGVKGVQNLVRTNDLVALLKPLAGPLVCLILNACESLPVAEELSESIPGLYVVGMRQTQLDSTALAFSKAFYQALGAGHPIETVFQIAKSGLRIGPFDESQKPVLFQDGRAI